MTPTLEELLGGAPIDAGAAPEPAPRKRGRKSRTPKPTPAPDAGVIDFADLPDTPDAVRQEVIRQTGTGRAFIESGMLRRPVSMNVLALVFGMDAATVKKRLLPLKPLAHAGGGRPVYDFREAVAYLIPPKMDVAQYIESLDPNELPNRISKPYWQAKRERLRYFLDAGQAWPTDAVLEVFGLTFMTIKDRTQLWTETLREVAGLTDDQYSRLMEMVDAFQTDLHARLIDIPNRRQSFALLHESFGEDEPAAETDSGGGE